MTTSQRRSSRTHRPTKRARGDISDSDEEPTPARESSPTPSSPPPETRSRASRRSLTPKERFNERYKTSTNSAQDVLDLQLKQWTSSVYDHFIMPPDIDEEGDEIKYIFKCKTHPQTTLSRVRHDDSTSNLNRHIERCAHVDTPESQAMEKFASGSTYTEVKHRIKIALWIARRRRPYSIAEDEELLDMFHDLNPSCTTPSCTTISRDVQEIHEITKTVVMEILASVKGKIHISADGWSTPNADLNGRLPRLPRSVRAASATAITKLRKLAIKTTNSPTILHALYEICDKVHIPRKRSVKDVPTRWNSTAELVTRGIELRPALDRLVMMSDFNKPGGVRLGRYRLLSDDWDTLEGLLPMLNLLMFATKEISKSKVPLIHDVIPLIDAITSALDEVIDDPIQSLTVRHAALRGVLLLNKYYAKTDDTIIYRIAMILHPRHKTAYFEKAKWESEWVAVAKALARNEWQENYKPKPVERTNVRAQDDSSSTPDGRFSKARRHFDLYRDHGTPSSDSDALEDWLSSPPIATNADPITYWNGMLATGHPLAQMALDFLSVPATSTDVERAFSRGGLTVSKLRHNLSDRSVRSATVLGMWVEHGDLVPMDTVTRVFEEKRRRGKGKSSSSPPSGAEVINVDV
ncbi:hypothetical protein D9619_011038 [Psilocybe cf. subviscida]|uniref:HAT C-terminal dimerisation domain-containing protein n=1 Tax=Psilocybe cf. subviscida TaxID=2480587 RepID=A0A8H5B8C9_9AGAR|nr:hypothetical protein D9619_011038 [Psilocybe cf. subviscida]